MGWEIWGRFIRNYETVVTKILQIKFSYPLFVFCASPAAHKAHHFGFVVLFKDESVEFIAAYYLAV